MQIHSGRCPHYYIKSFFPTQIFSKIPFLALDLAKFLNPDFFHFGQMATLLVPSFGTFGLGKCPDPDIWANLGQCPDLDILPNSFSFDPTCLGLCSSTQDIVHVIISKVFFQLKFIPKSDFLVTRSGHLGQLGQMPGSGHFA